MQTLQAYTLDKHHKNINVKIINLLLVSLEVVTKSIEFFLLGFRALASLSSGV